MKKEEFRKLVKEIIKEVMTESDEPETNDADAPVDMTGVPSPTSKTDKAWRGKMRTLDKIKAEPDFKKKLGAVQFKHGDA
jgi:hypothetical protein